MLIVHCSNTVAELEAHDAVLGASESLASYE